MRCYFREIETHPATAICGSSKFWDRETSLSYYGERYFPPALGRPLNRDPLGEAGSGGNLLSFLRNNAVNKNDPIGLTSGSLADLEAGAGTAAGLEAAGGASVALGVKASALALVAKISLAAYDSYSTYETLTDPNSSGVEKVFTAGGFVAGVIIPGGGTMVEATERGVQSALSLAGKKAFRSQARRIFEKESGKALGDLAVHHRIPLEYAHLFPGDPNRVANLVAVDGATHKAVNAIWTQFRTQLSGRVPSASEILAVARRIDDQFGTAMKFVN